MTMMPADLRARLEAGYQPVRVLRSPLSRGIWVMPIALVALFAAPIAFNVRPDASHLGWSGVWGLSLIQSVLGLAVVVAALRESVPGRGWSPSAIGLWLAIPIAMVIAITLVSWNASPVLLRSEWWLIGGMCFAASSSRASSASR